MTDSITSLPAAVSALGALPMPAGDVRPIAALDVPLPQVQVDAWNLAHPVGTPVVAYPGCRPEDDPTGERLVTATRSRAEVLGGHTAVVWVHGHGACIALTHIDVRAEATRGELAEYRHLLYDADEDATVPAFPYPTPLEA